MKLLLKSIASVLIALILGLAFVLWAINSPPGENHNITNGAWHTNLAIGSPQAGMYIRALDAEYLVPHHTRPLTGSEKIYETLTNYRDAIQYIHDQTIRLMNQGRSPMEIVEKVKLPRHLARQPYLQEYYGTVPWSVRAIFDGYLGWFGGNPTDLFPLAPAERAKRFLDLAGSQQKLMQHAEQAVGRKGYQWALELTDQLLQIDPESDGVRKLKADTLSFVILLCAF